MWTKAYLSIGTNMGDRLANLKQAVRLLERRPEIEVTSISSVYETAPVGGVVQANFLNIAVGLSTNLSAWDLLAWLHVIEQSLHRRRLIHWGPRTIDLDIVLYGCTRLTSPTLKIPPPGNGQPALCPGAPARNHVWQGTGILAPSPTNQGHPGRGVAYPTN